MRSSSIIQTCSRVIRLGMVVCFTGLSAFPADYRRPKGTCSGSPFPILHPPRHLHALRLSDVACSRLCISDLAKPAVLNPGLSARYMLESGINSCWVRMLVRFPYLNEWARIDYGVEFACKFKGESRQVRQVGSAWWLLAIQPKPSRVSITDDVDYSRLCRCRGLFSEGGEAVTARQRAHRVMQFGTHVSGYLEDVRLLRGRY